MSMIPTNLIGNQVVLMYLTQGTQSNQTQSLLPYVNQSKIYVAPITVPNVSLQQNMQSWQNAGHMNTPSQYPTPV